MNELDQLRADLAVLERYQCTEVAKMHCREQIARKLEVEQADPWREVKGVISLWRTEPDCFLPTTAMIVAYVDHLTAKNEQLAARVAELEANLPRWLREHDDHGK